MGTDISSYVEIFDGERWSWAQGDLFPDNDPRYDKPWEPFPGRSDYLFGFLAGVRDRDVPQIHPCRGLPVDLSPELREKFGFTFPDDCTHYRPSWSSARTCGCVYVHSGLFGHSWATGAELVGFDFERTFRCPLAHGDARPTWLEPCEHPGDRITVAEYLGGWLDRFREIAALTADPSHVRAVFAFDN